MAKQPKPMGKPPKRAKSEQTIGDEIGVSQSTARSWLNRKTDPMPADGPERQAWLERHGKTSGGGQATRIPSEHGRSSNERLLAEAEQVAKLEKARKQNELLGIAIAVKKKELVPRIVFTRIMAQHITDARVLLSTIPDNIALFVGDPVERETVKNESRRIVNDSLRALAKGLAGVESTEAA